MAEKKDSFLLVGYFGEGNLGDEAVLRGALSVIQDAFKNPRIMCLWGGKGSLPENIVPVDRKNPLAILSAISKCTIVLAPGGSLFQDVTGLISIPYYAGILFTANLLGRKTAALSQGFGPVRSNLSRFILKTLLKRLDILTARDSDSKNSFESFGLSCSLSPDAAFCLPEISDHADNSEINKDLESPSGKQKKVITIIPRIYEGWNKDCTELAKAIIWYKSQGYSISALPMQGNDFNAIIDLEKKIWEFSKNSEVNPSEIKSSYLESEIINIIKLSTPEEIIKVLRHSDLVIAVRLHGMLLALAAGNTVISIGYDPKVISLSREYDTKCLSAGSVHETEIIKNSSVDSVHSGIGPTVVKALGSARLRYRSLILSLK